MKQRITTTIGFAIAILATATVAHAGNVTATATVTGAGALSLSHGASASVTDTLDGSDQSVGFSLPLTLVDARGTGAGWNLTITSTTFGDGSGHNLATSAGSISAVASSCNSGGSCTNPTNASTYPLTVPAASTAPAAVKFFNAAAATGLGRFTITPTLNVLIPGNAYAGSYSSTLTVAAVSGP
jgi:hypothetical protein